MGQNGEATKRRRIADGVLLLLTVGGAGAVVWGLFRFVVTDERLVLDYVEALAWPGVVGAMLFWLRGPLRDKFGQLLRFEGFGASAQFSPEAQGELLQAELGPELDDLFAEADPVEQGDAASEPGPEAALESTEDLSGTQTSQGSTRPEVDPAAISAEDLMGLVKGLGVPVLERQELRGALQDPERRYGAIRELEDRARTLAKNRALLAARNEQSRDSIESVIRKSADWGYEMGKAGAPRAVPDIEWSEDGGWRITTEVPASARVSTKRSRSDSSEADRIRQIRSLEDEIKELERQSYSPFGGVADTMVNGPWLSELKRRLGRVDPGNPWSMGRTHPF